MRARNNLLAIGFAFLATAVMGQDFPKRSSDTLWIDSIGTHSGQKAVLDIGFANADTVNGIDLPLTYGDPAILIDSVSFVDSRIEDGFFTVVTIDTAKAICHIGAFLDFEPDAHGVPAGFGHFARLYMQIPDEYPGKTIYVDTARLQTGLTFVDAENHSYVPIFERGVITNTYTPELYDSIWVDDVSVSSGEEFAVTVYLDNELPAFNIRLPLEYASDNITFDSAAFAGTRSENAILADAIADNVGKRMLLSLGFEGANLLPSGSGPIANLYFTCLFSGSSTDVVLDTTDQYLADYYLQLGALFGFVNTYPRYLPGTITVDISTDVDGDREYVVPAEYRLDQNSPNPFNPTTTISFALPERSHVSLEVFNVLGQRVRSLKNKMLPAGYYTVTFDSRDDAGKVLGSGIYLYRLKTDTFTRSRKMILLK